uniref:Uncharacterized protein n=1 Tax=Lotharella globosa TaxID=91324 RepID=A0A6V3R1E0_9EUKA
MDDYKFDEAKFFELASESSKLAENVSKKLTIELKADKYIVKQDSFVKFLHCLHEAEESDGVLEVGVPILAKEGYPSRMLVRDTVKDHIEDTLKHLDRGKRVVHYGTPGYGKSMTGVLVVKKKMGKKLIVIQQGKTWYFVPKDFPGTCVVKSMFPETMKAYAIAQAGASGGETRPIFHLIDPQGHHTVPVIVFGGIAEQLATVSPNTLLLNNDLRLWEKQYGRRIRKVEPHWENEDMKKCYEKCYKSLFALDEYEKRLHFWGNNPRNVFGEMDLVRNALEPAITDLRPADVKQYLEEEGLLRGTGEKYAKSYIVHWLYDRKSEKTLKKIASPYVMQRLFEKANAHELKDLKAFGKKLVAGAARGDLPSIVAADWLERQVFDFFIEKKLDMSTCQKLRTQHALEPADGLSMKGIKRFKNKKFSDVDFEQDYLYVPDWRTLESIDAFFLHDGILYALQVTFAEEHKIKNAGVVRLLKAASKRLSKDLKYYFIFVVPNATRNGRDIIKGYKAQAYVTSKGGELKTYPKAEIAQLLFPFPIQV